MEKPEQYCLGRDEIGTFDIYEAPTPQECGKLCDAYPNCISFEWNTLSEAAKCSLSTSCIEVFSQKKEFSTLFIKGGARSLQFAYCYLANVPPAQIIDIDSYLGDLLEEEEE
jgi:hypothetical protein